MNLYLIDGNSYIYRAFYAIKALSNSKGFPTNAIYGFTNMLLKIIKEKKPDGIVISFDSPAQTERHRIFEAYKAQRKETPGELVRQLPAIRQITSAFNIKIFELPGYEADDLLSTIAVTAVKNGATVFIVTGDKDMLQVVGNGVKIYDPVKDRVLDEAYVIEKFGVGPERVAEFMALTGDAADNIPGIKGIGEKTAKELLLSFNSLEELLDHPERIKAERLRNLVSENRDIARLSKRLVTIDTNVPIDVDIKEFSIKEPDWPALHSLFGEFEFTRLMKLIPSVERHIEYEAIFSINRLAELLDSIKGIFAFDIEATGKDPQQDSIVGISISSAKARAWYIPLGHSYLGAPEQVDKEEALKLLTHFFEDANIAKVGHNLKYDIAMLRKEGINVSGTLYDTMLASYLINPNRQSHSLEETGFEYIAYRKKSFQEVLAKRKVFSEVPIEEAAPYAAEDAALALELKNILFERLREEDMLKVYTGIEEPLLNVLVDVENAGIKVDVNKLSNMSKELSLELDAIERRIYFIAGEEFNVNSPKQISRVLFHTLGLKPGKKTKTGFSTDVGVLEELALSHELPGEILNYRSLSKLKSTYTDALPLMVNPETRRIHTSFNQTVTSTGRLSSSEPNLQNIPIRGEWGKRIRSVFIAENRHVIVSADYSNIELRVLAHLSGDQGLVDAFRSDTDIHTRTASELFGVSPERVSSEMRRVAKTVNFGVVYGMSPFGLSEALNISAVEAKKYIEEYFKRHPGVKTYIEQTLIAASEKGYVLTLFGRKRPVLELMNKNSNIRSSGERLAVNSPIQGTAADIIKIAMINIWKAIRKEGLETRLILQVHDELVFESPEVELENVIPLIQGKMESVTALAVPLKVNIGHGSNWAEAHK